ncbi:MAG: hypothetical protein WCI43_06475 [Candidatus Firestonebacteria bacterium]
MEVIDKQRPFGITVLGILLLTHSLVYIFGIIIAPRILGNIPKFTFWAALMFEIAVFISAVGLLWLKRWSRISTMVLVAIYIVNELRILISCISATARVAKIYLAFYQKLLVQDAIWVIFEMLIILYLSSPKVKAQFK